jgi:hypothetical protein
VTLARVLSKGMAAVTLAARQFQLPHLSIKLVQRRNRHYESVDESCTSYQERERVSLRGMHIRIRPQFCREERLYRATARCVRLVEPSRSEPIAQWRNLSVFSCWVSIWSCVAILFLLSRRNLTRQQRIGTVRVPLAVFAFLLRIDGALLPVLSRFLLGPLSSSSLRLLEPSRVSLLCRLTPSSHSASSCARRPGEASGRPAYTSLRQVSASPSSFSSSSQGADTGSSNGRLRGRVRTGEGGVLDEVEVEDCDCESQWTS